MDRVNRFPKQKKIRKQWLEFCEINEHILNTVTRICSNHFREELKKKLSKGIVLKPNAVPSVHIKKKTISEQSNSVLNEVYDSTKQKYNATDNTTIYCNVSVSSNWQTPTKTIRDPRFVNEIITPHLATSRKWTIKQQRKIKPLKQARNRLVAHITTMKGLVKHLQQKNLLTKAVAENLQVGRNSRSFALTLNFYSSKAIIRYLSHLFNISYCEINTHTRTDSILITVKNRGNLILPSDDVIKITKYCILEIGKKERLITGDFHGENGSEDEEGEVRRGAPSLMKNLRERWDEEMEGLIE
ncbi:hypothetical protein ALC57_13289 [Trachymyrmex cornetzi]|uniref:THAP-type domain-containing protein n=1 Tax=Trachymyrmex cornetzi TaxID=471704 RepID=A0A151IZW7_9HYME|nr:hypothetical protein ALC57_13289 [Trachymyrmex cornetzi]